MGNTVLDSTRLDHKRTRDKKVNNLNLSFYFCLLFFSKNAQ